MATTFVNDQWWTDLNFASSPMHALMLPKTPQRIRLEANLDQAKLVLTARDLSDDVRLYTFDGHTLLPLDYAGVLAGSMPDAEAVAAATRCLERDVGFRAATAPATVLLARCLITLHQATDADELVAKYTARAGPLDDGYLGTIAAHQERIARLDVRSSEIITLETASVSADYEQRLERLVTTGSLIPTEVARLDAMEIEPRPQQGSGTSTVLSGATAGARPELAEVWLNGAPLPGNSAFNASLVPEKAVDRLTLARPGVALTRGVDPLAGYTDPFLRLYTRTAANAIAAAPSEGPNAFSLTVTGGRDRAGAGAAGFIYSGVSSGNGFAQHRTSSAFGVAEKQLDASDTKLTVDGFVAAAQPLYDRVGVDYTVARAHGTVAAHPGPGELRVEGSLARARLSSANSASDTETLGTVNASYVISEIAIPSGDLSAALNTGWQHANLGGPGSLGWRQGSGCFAAFELGVPVVEQHGIPLVDQLDLKPSALVEHSFGRTLRLAQTSATWTLIRDTMTVRGTWGRSVAQPAVLSPRTRELELLLSSDRGRLSGDLVWRDATTLLSRHDPLGSVGREQGVTARVEFRPGYDFPLSHFYSRATYTRLREERWEWPQQHVATAIRTQAGVETGWNYDAFTFLAEYVHVRSDATGVAFATDDSAAELINVSVTYQLSHRQPFELGLRLNDAFNRKLPDRWTLLPDPTRGRELILSFTVEF